MNIEKLREIVQANEDSFREFILDISDKVITLEGTEFKLIRSERLNSGYDVVFLVEDKYYMLEGSYDSWNGTEFYDITEFHEVKPVDRTVTFYEKV